MSLNINGMITAEIDVSDYDHDIEISVDHVSDLMELADDSGITQEEIFEYIVDGEIMAHLNTNIVCSWLEDHCPVDSFAKVIAVAAAQLQGIANATEQRNVELRDTVAKQSEKIGELTTNNISS